MSCNVAFIGLGVMGYPMAGYISKGGHNVTVYNRTGAKADKWIKEFKGKKADTPKDAAKDETTTNRRTSSAACCRGCRNLPGPGSNLEFSREREVEDGPTHVSPGSCTSKT